LTYFDAIMLAIIAYSCFFSAFYTAFDYKFEENMALFVLEYVVFVSFTFDIIFHFMRPFKNEDNEESATHTEIAKKYLMGSFFFDLLATFPFFLIKTGTDSNYGLYFKLIRLTRIPKVYRLLDMDKFTKLSDALFAGTARGKRVVF
jgi:hypothetical protein